MFNIGNPYPRQKQNIFVTDFRDGTVGAAPVGWTKRWGTAHYTALVQNSTGSISGKALVYTTTVGSGLGLHTWDRVPLVADCEILVRSRMISVPSTITMINRPAARGAGGVATESAYTALAFYHTSSATDWRVQTNKNVAGTASIISSVDDGIAPLISAAAPSVWVWTRFRLVGTSLSRKSWQNGTAEPGAFQNTVVDASITAAGWVGEYLAEGFAQTRETDFFSVALKGRTAPGP